MGEQTTQGEPFPDTPRALYRRSPLREVICQVRFPAVLRIDSEAPAAFQERIRDVFPLFEQPAPLPLPGIPHAALAELFRAGAPTNQHGAYNFLTEDRTWTLTLTRDFLALSTSSYPRWEEFRSRLLSPLQAVGEIYKPSFIRRIGLRYLNLIKRSSLGLGDASWSELLSRPILGELGDSSVGPFVHAATRQLLIDLPRDQGRVNFQHAIAREDNVPEDVYIIDLDFFTEEKAALADAGGILDRFNKYAGAAFRWCIQERLHRALEPLEPGPDTGV